MRKNDFSKELALRRGFKSHMEKQDEKVTLYM